MEFKKELVSENATTKTYIIREKKYPFHAFCVHKESGLEVEQASTVKAFAIQLAEAEMSRKLKAGQLKKPKEKS